MKFFEIPAIEVLKFAVADVIATSAEETTEMVYDPPCLP